MRLPPSHAIEGSEEQSGFWFQVSNAQGKPVYRRVMPNPIQTDVEVFSDTPEQTVRRQVADEPKGTFVLLVPETDETRTLSLFRSATAAGREATPAPAREFARFDLAASEE
jgi:hypothetical protein